MSLVTRLSTFFLAALALVLIIFSVSLFVLAGSYLRRQLDQQLTGSLDALEASLHFEEDNLQWKPDERRLVLGVDQAIESPRWAIKSSAGKLIDRSANSRGSDFPTSWLPAGWPAGRAEATVFADTPAWRLAARRVRPKDFDDRRRDPPDEDDDEHAELILLAGASPLPIAQSLGQLRNVAILLSVAAWVTCAVVGRQVCRRALSPVSRLAAAAEQMPSIDTGQRLPVPEMHDELWQLSAAFNGLLDRLHAAAERQRRFAGDASHQLRTPISGLLSLVEVTRRRPRSEQEYEAALDRVRQEVTRMRQIVESLLFLARRDSNSSAAVAEPLELGGWLAQQVERWQQHPRAGDLRLVPPPVEPLWIAAQPVLLAQVFDNLLDNACKYSLAGSAITIAPLARGGEAGFSITDRGVGIEPADAARLFEPFYRAPSALESDRTGLGLGLAIAREIVTSFGGRLGLVPAESGNCFEVWFPSSQGKDIRSVDHQGVGSNAG